MNTKTESNNILAESETDTLHKLTGITNLTDTTYILRFEKKDLDFIAGQHITLGLPGDTQMREYSVYSGNREDYLEVLIREVEDGLVSKKLKKLKVGDMLNVEGPFGFFTLNKKKIENQKHLFIATGTGIAPFHSIVKSYDKLDYKILHGVRYENETYGRSEYDQNHYLSCTSRDKLGDFNGYVTDYLKQNEIDINTLVYLCGNYEMIQEVYDILTTKGLPADNIRTEVYF